jgi:hypothetical protein
MISKGTLKYLQYINLGYSLRLFPYYLQCSAGIGYGRVIFGGEKRAVLSHVLISGCILSQLLIVFVLFGYDGIVEGIPVSDRIEIYVIGVLILIFKIIQVLFLREMSEVYSLLTGLLSINDTLGTINSI